MVSAAADAGGYKDEQTAVDAGAWRRHTKECPFSCPQERNQPGGTLKRTGRTESDRTVNPAVNPDAVKDGNHS